MNTYAISDIHGNAERLEILMKYLNKKHPKGDFCLYVIGDLFDRGESSDRVVEAICNNPNNIKVLKGNHEELFMNFMENPESEYYNWQSNYSYPTIMSFLNKHLNSLVGVGLSDLNIEKEYDKRYHDLTLMLNERFSRFEGYHRPEDYITQIKYCSSNRDVRKVSDGLNRLLLGKLTKHRKQFDLISEYLYLLLLEDFCVLYDYFSQLDKYAIVDDKYLLVHSGFVSKNKDPNVIDNLSNNYYNECETIDDLISQNEKPLIWSRRFLKSEQRAIAPQERFDGKIIIFGHTSTSNFNKDGSNSAYFEYDKKGNLTSIAIDGENYNKLHGKLNCINLDNLSQIVLSGTSQYKNEFFALTLETIEYASELEK